MAEQPIKVTCPYCGSEKVIKYGTYAENVSDSNGFKRLCEA